MPGSSYNQFENNVIGCIFQLILVGIAFILFVTVTSSIGLYLLGWGITYGILALTNQMTNNGVSDNGFWVLGICALVWGGIAKIFAGTVTLWVGVQFNVMLAPTWLVAVASLIGLSWGVLSIFLIEQLHTVPDQIEGSGTNRKLDDEDEADDYGLVWDNEMQEMLGLGDDF